jgi:tetratricopeptide (TPR) repeat protein
MRRNILAVGVSILWIFGITFFADAQWRGITIPPNGDNQHSIVTQGIGLVQISIDYSSPDVHAPDGSDRRGKIWGTLVPYGMSNLGFGTCGDQCPWRGGANENTVFKTSHDIKVQGQPLKAGSYGLHFIPAKDADWTIIFSNNSTAWGSFTYKKEEDALRVTAKPEKSDYHEWLTYEFIDRQPNKATVALKWEDLQLPFTITIDNMDDLYVQQIDDELRDSPGFNWQAWDAAAQWALQAKKLDKGLEWAQAAVSFPFIGQENFQTLSTLSQLQAANGKVEEAKATMDKALNHRTAGPLDLHGLARSLQAQKKTDEAVRIFELNAKRFPNQWPVEVGLTRAYSAKGDYKEALKHANIALKQAPDDLNKTNLQTMIKTLESGKDVN